MLKPSSRLLAFGLGYWLLPAAAIYAQGYGTDTHNVVNPASGGMAGVSFAAPQDNPSAVFGNPATLTQFYGSQFTMGGAWTDGTVRVRHDGFLTGGTPFSVRSGMQGFVTPTIGVTQDLRSKGIPLTFGLGLTGLSGLGAEYRDLAPVGGDISGEMLVLGTNLAAGYELTDRLSIGAALTLGTGFSQFGLVQTGAMIHDYGIRGTTGLNYELTDATSVGLFYQSEMGFTYSEAFRFPDGTYRDIAVEQPQNVGLGLANRSLFDGRLLLGVDFLYKNWDRADLYSDVFVDQWAVATGAQWTQGRVKLRTGYSYNSDPVDHAVGSVLSGLPVAQAAVEYYQATSLAAISRHRISGGFGLKDVLICGLDMDFFAGGLLREEESFGAHSSSDVAIYYVGTGLTWRYGARRAGLSR